MKKGSVIAIILILVVVVAGGVYFVMTSSNHNKTNDKLAKETSQGQMVKTAGDGYTFVANGKEIKIGEEFSREKFGQEEKYSEIASCAFEGLDKTYTYENYEITTYPNGDKENILSIYFLDDAEETAKTKEGVTIADSYAKMVEAYGENYDREDNSYIYTKGNMNLKFIVENDVITSIEYSLIVNVK